MQTLRKSAPTLVAAALLYSGLAVAAELEEVIVTAQKREQSLQEVPIATTALSAGDLSAAGVTSMEQLAMATPGLSFNNSTSFLQPYVRGVGALNPGAGTHGSVAIYFDDVYIARSYTSMMSLDNIEQIEVLKGPQSTLYGRNATGGAISIRTKVPTPDQEFEGKLSGTLGDFDHRRGSIYLSGGFNEYLAGSIAGTVAQRDGFHDNNTPFPGGVLRGNGDDLGELDSTFVQGKLTFEPNDRMTFTLGAFYREEDGTVGFNWTQVGPQSALFTLQLQAAGIEGAFGLPPGTLTNTLAGATFDPAFRGSTDSIASSNIEETGIDLHANFDIGENLELVSITAYKDSEQNGDVDLFRVVQLPTLGFQSVFPNEFFSQEVRLQSTGENDLVWMVGADYIKDESGDPTILNGTIWPTVLPDLLGLGPGVVPGGISDWETTGWSVFADATYSFADTYNLTVGGRYTKEEFELSDLLVGNSRPTVDDSNTTWRVVLDRGFDWGLLYGSLSRGFVTGGYNTQNGQSRFVEPETLTSFELGFKSDLSASFRLNGALFFYDYEDVHTQVVGGATGGTTFLLNGPEAEVQGVDLEFAWAATENFSLDGGLVYLFQREYTDFDVPADPASLIPGVSATGNDMVGAPELSVVVNGEYRVPLASGGLRFNLNLAHNSGYFLNADNFIGTGGALDDSGYSVVNARVTWTNADESIEISAWANNVFDEEYFTGGNTNSQIDAIGVFPATGSAVVVMSDPATFGVTASYSF